MKLWVCKGLIFILDRWSTCTSCVGYYQCSVMITLSCMLVLQIHWVLGKCPTERLAVVEVHRDKFRVAELRKVTVWRIALAKVVKLFHWSLLFWNLWILHFSMLWSKIFLIFFFIPYDKMFLINRKRREEKETKLDCNTSTGNENLTWTRLINYVIQFALQCITTIMIWRIHPPKKNFKKKKLKEKRTNIGPHVGRGLYYIYICKHNADVCHCCQ